MNRIPQSQNEPTQLQRLGAQRELYSVAKAVLAVQMILGVPVAILLALAAWKWECFRPTAAFVGIAILMFDSFLLTPWLKKRRETAAKIQEAFDCDVLELPWPNQKAGKKIDHEVEVAYSIQYQMRAAKCHPVDNWYPVTVGQLPLSVARGVCQRANCWWDSTQRRRYATLVLALLFGVVVVIAGVAFASKVTFQQFVVMGVAPLLPLFKVCFTQFQEHRDAAIRLDKLKEDAKELFEDACKDPTDRTLESRARALQDEIFESRKRNPPLFDWIFKRIRPAFEVEMNLSAEQLVNQFKASRQ